MMQSPRSLFAAAAAAGLTACAGMPAPIVPPSPLEAPATWQAPLPHNGALSDLRGWWQQFDDPLLSALIDGAQAVSPTIASARSRIEQARAARVAAGAALRPGLDASASASRGRPDVTVPVYTSAAVGLQASWELDLFGANRAGLDAADARFEGAQGDWHAARVAVVAEVANTYTALRACEAQLVQTAADAASRNETSRLTTLAAQAGFQAPASAALARASAAQGNSLLTQQRASCDMLVKSLVELTGSDEPGLRGRLADRVARVPQPAQLSIASVPAEALAQRPDLFSAAREVLAASAEVAEADARRYPRIALSGNIGAALFESSAGRLDGSVWRVGPVSVSLPIFDGGRLAANVDAARARALDAAATYRASLRAAVREVESALVSLQSTADRSASADAANRGFAESLAATDALYKSGLASLFELEDARRSALQAQSAVIDLQRERVTAWITLYRAVGGGWSPADLELAGTPEVAP